MDVTKEAGPVYMKVKRLTANARYVVTNNGERRQQTELSMTRISTGRIVILLVLVLCAAGAVLAAGRVRDRSRDRQCDGLCGIIAEGGGPAKGEQGRDRDRRRMRDESCALSGQRLCEGLGPMVCERSGRPPRRRCPANINRWILESPQ